MDFNDYYTVAAGILNGDFDEYLNGLADTVANRKATLAPKARDYAVGDKVKYASIVRPKYLAGAKGTITKINRTKVVVMLDQPVGRFRGNITTPVNLIERV